MGETMPSAPDMLRDQAEGMAQALRRERDALAQRIEQDRQRIVGIEAALRGIDTMLGNVASQIPRLPNPGRGGPSPVVDLLLPLLSTGPKKRAELVSAALAGGFSPQGVEGMLVRYMQRGQIRRVSSGVYALADSAQPTPQEGQRDR